MPSKKEDGAADNVLTLVTTPIWIITMIKIHNPNNPKYLTIWKLGTLPQDIVHVNDIHAHFDEMSENNARCTPELSEAKKGAQS